MLNHFDEPPYAKGIALDLAKINANAEHRVTEFDIRTQSISTTPGPRCPAATSRRWCWPGSCPGRWRR